MLGIARYVLLDYYKRSRKRGMVDELDDCSVHDLAPGITTRLAKREEEELLLQALRRLSIEEQIVLELRFWENLKHREISSILDAPEGTTVSRIRRAEQKLRALLPELTDNAELLERTSTGLETWARRIRQRLTED